jgi:hypothetical protein
LEDQAIPFCASRSEHTPAIERPIANIFATLNVFDRALLHAKQHSFYRLFAVPSLASNV